MPGLSGPGIDRRRHRPGGLGAFRASTSSLGHILIALGIAVVGVISYITLQAATKLSKVLGIAGMNTMARIMGFLPDLHRCAVHDQRHTGRELGVARTV